MDVCDSVFSDLVGKTCEKIYNEIAKEEWYIQLQDEMISLKNNIISNYGKNIIHQLDKYDSFCLKIHSKTEQHIVERLIKEFIFPGKNDTSFDTKP